MDDYDLLEGVGVPFANTAHFEGQSYLNKHLEMRDDHRPVMEPIPPTFDKWSSDESSSGEDSPLMPDSFEIFDAVSSRFGPGGADSEEFLFKMNDKESALADGKIDSMTLITDLGEWITVRPRCIFRDEIKRACVEMTVSNWMERQRALPPTAANKHEVQWRFESYEVDGEVKRVAVWLWRGLERIPGQTHIFKLHL